MDKSQQLIGLRLGDVISKLQEQQDDWYNKQMIINNKYQNWIKSMLQKGMLIRNQQNGFIVEYNKQLFQNNIKFNYVVFTIHDWIRFYFEQSNLSDQKQIDILSEIEPYGHFQKYIQKYDQAVKGLKNAAPNQKFIVMLNYNNNNVLIYNKNVLISANKSALNARLTKINLYPISSLQGQQFSVVYNLNDGKMYLHKDLLNCDHNTHNSVQDQIYIQQKQQPYQVINYLYQTFGQNVSVIQAIMQQESSIFNSNEEETQQQEDLYYNNSLCLYNNIIIQADSEQQLNNNLNKIYQTFKYYPFGTTDPQKPLINWYYDIIQQKYVEYKLIDTNWLQIKKQEQNTFSMYCQNIQQVKTLLFGKSMLQFNSQQNMLSAKVQNMINILKLGYDLYCFTEADWIQQMILNCQEFCVDQNNNITFTAQNGTQYKCLYSGFYRQIEQINNIHLDSLMNVMFINLDKFNIIKSQQVNLGKVVLDKQWLNQQGVQNMSVFKNITSMFNTALIVELEQKSNQQHLIIVINYPTWNFNFSPLQFLMFKYIEEQIKNFNENNYPVIMCGDQNITPKSPCNMLFNQDSVTLQQFIEYQQRQIDTDPDYERVKNRIYFNNVFTNKQEFKYQYFNYILGMKSYYNQAYQSMTQDISVENGFEYKDYFAERQLDNMIVNDLLLTTKTDGQFQDTLDYIYYSSKNNNLKPIDFEDNMRKMKMLIDSVINTEDTFPNNLSLSDHMPITASFQLDQKQ